MNNYCRRFAKTGSRDYTVDEEHIFCTKICTEILWFKKFYLLFMCMKRVCYWLFALLVILCPFFAQVSAVDSDPFVLIPKAIDKEY